MKKSKGVLILNGKEYLPQEMECVNTLNSWGFGGWYGWKFIYQNGMIRKVGKICYRHADPDKINE